MFACAMCWCLQSNPEFCVNYLIGAGLGKTMPLAATSFACSCHGEIQCFRLFQEPQQGPDIPTYQESQLDRPASATNHGGKPVSSPFGARGTDSASATAAKLLDQIGQFHPCSDR